jgi:hypothetical protein
MALINCAECGHAIAKSAMTCPSCGATNKARTRRLAILVGVLVALWLVGLIVQKYTEYEDIEAKEQTRQAVARAVAEHNRKDATRRQVEEARLAAMSLAQRAAEDKKLAEEASARRKAADEAKEKLRLAKLRREGLAWNYRTYRDDLTGKLIESAEVRSTNTVNFDFPYQGPQRAMLMLRRHPQYGLDVILFVERGQFLCSIDDCLVSAVFDDGSVELFTALEPADHSTTSLFIRYETRFIERLRRSEKARISASFFQQGAPTFEFNVGNLEWK